MALIVVSQRLGSDRVAGSNRVQDQPGVEIARSLPRIIEKALYYAKQLHAISLEHD